jgi:phosphoribosylanthranilate isomerase
VKICGITRLEDAMAALRMGADALGFVFAESPRRMAPDRAREIVRAIPPLIQTVGLFVNEHREEMEEIKRYVGLDVLQLHGDESPEEVAQLRGRVIKALRVRADGVPNEDDFPDVTLLLDAHAPSARGGTGRSFDWTLATEVALRRPVILAGGLTPENVTEAIRVVGPYAVDVSSGVELAPGRKDHDKMARFIRNAKGSEQSPRVFY